VSALDTLLTAAGGLAAGLATHLFRRRETRAGHADAAAAADATGRHAVHAAEVGVVPKLLERIEALEKHRDEGERRCDERITALRRQYAARLLNLGSEVGLLRDALAVTAAEAHAARLALWRYEGSDGDPPEPPKPLPPGALVADLVDEDDVPRPTPSDPPPPRAAGG
jgi:hypothetical protein